MSNRSVKALMLLTTFAASLSSLSLELSLTRVYSFLLVYHYVFIAVSVSVLGLGLGSWWVHARGRQSLAWVGSPCSARARTSTRPGVSTCLS